MSLIMDALKKAQKLKFKETPGVSSPSSMSLPQRERGQSRKTRRGLFICIGLACIAILLLMVWRFFMAPLTPSSFTSFPKKEGTVKEASVPLADKKIKVSSQDILSAVSIEGPKDIFSPIKESIRESKEPEALMKEALSISKDVPSRRKDSLSQPKEPLSVSTPPQTKKISIPKAEPLPPLAPPPPPMKLEEKPPEKLIEVKAGSEKDRFSPEVLNHFNLAVQLYNQREFQKAIQAYQKVIELDSTYVEAYNNLGIIYQELGDLDQAFATYQKAIQTNPHYEKGYNNIGIIHYLKGQYREAIEAFQKALAINPNNIESYINLGVLFKKQGQLNQAIDCYQKALDINPLQKEIHYNIALLYEQFGNIEWAINHYQQFIRLASPSQPDLVLKVQRRLDDLIKTRRNK